MKSSRKKKAEPLSQRLKTDFQKNWLLYVMLLPVLIYLIIFCYAPMYGVIIAFKNFKPRLGIFHSEFVGLDKFRVCRLRILREDAEEHTDDQWIESSLRLQRSDYLCDSLK